MIGNGLYQLSMVMTGGWFTMFVPTDLHGSYLTPGQQANAKVEQAWLRDEGKNPGQVSEAYKHSNIT